MKRISWGVLVVLPAAFLGLAFGLRFLFSWLLVGLSIACGVGLATIWYGRVITQLEAKVFELQIENEKLEQQRDMWQRTANLPDAEEHRQPLDNAELERRNDLIDDVIDERNL